MGEAAYKGFFPLVSVVGFALLVWGYGVAWETPVVVWTPPVGMRNAASLLTLVAFILLVALCTKQCFQGTPAPPGVGRQNLGACPLAGQWNAHSFDLFWRFPGLGGAGLHFRAPPGRSILLPHGVER